MPLRDRVDTTRLAFEVGKRKWLSTVKLGKLHVAGGCWWRLTMSESLVKRAIIASLGNAEDDQGDKSRDDQNGNCWKGYLAHRVSLARLRPGAVGCGPQLAGLVHR